jgi:penicillin-binding protein 1B
MRVAVLAAAAVTVWVGLEGLIVYRQFEGRRWNVPARVYASPLELYVGREMGREALIGVLRELGYRPAQGGPAEPAVWWASGSALRVRTRRVRFPDGEQASQTVQIDFRDGRIARLRRADGTDMAVMRLDPMEIGSIFPGHGEDRVVIRPDAVPDILREALITVEDRKFYSHFGVDPAAILRAAWANLRAGAIRQGGSTITQQLVKNYFLDNRRSMGRKLREAVMALWIDGLYGKDEILTAYVNEIYLGQDGRRAVHGFGLASRYYFGRPLGELSLHEHALLVALVRGPSYYNQWRHPERLTARRDRVIELLRERSLIDDATARAAAARPLGVLDHGSRAGYYPAYLDVVRRQLARDYRSEDLTSEGLQIFTALEPAVQQEAERSLAGRLARLAQADASMADLEGAVVVTRVQTGELTAVVGGRRSGFDGFNRAVNAARPVGSLIKPAVYLAAIEQGYSLADRIADETVEVPLEDGSIWRPGNFTGRAEGDVTLVRALAESLNMATTRLGLDVGLPAVIDVLRRLGVGAELPAYPSLLLGAVTMTPLEVAQAYATLASGGFRTPLRAVRAVLDAEGETVGRYPLAVVAAFEPGDVYQVNRGLMAVMARGSGRSAAERLPASLAVAGKTGTSDEFRDSWFAGFSGDNLAAVWLGRDDNRPAGLSGARGALQVWTDLMLELENRSFAPIAPAGLVDLWVDYGSGQFVGADCGDPVLIALAQDARLEVRPGCEVRARSLTDKVKDWLNRLGT